MITSVAEDRLLVVSDIHLGNRLFQVRAPFVKFLEYALKNGYSICINGDGIDIAHSTLSQITRDLSAFNIFLRKMARSGLRAYYVVGNHDILLEHFLDDWEILRLTPFLNVTSGNKRIHIEHGHLNDEAFLRFPKSYLFATWLGRWALKIHPRVYHALESLRTAFERFQRLFRPRRTETVDDIGGEGIPNEPAAFREGANEIIKHGFDYVILGHTHCHGEIELEGGSRYMNTGSWLRDPHFVEIDHGVVRFRSVASAIDAEVTLAAASGAESPVPDKKPEAGVGTVCSRLPTASQRPTVHAND